MTLVFFGRGDSAVRPNKTFARAQDLLILYFFRAYEKFSQGKIQRKLILIL